MAGQLKVRFQRGNVIVDLEGDAAEVQAQLADLKAHGLGKLMRLFELQTAVAGGVTGGQAGSAGGGGTGGGGTGPSAGPTPPLTNPAAALRFVVSALTLPQSQTIFATDLTGNGKPRNQFGNVIEVLRILGHPRRRTDEHGPRPRIGMGSDGGQRPPSPALGRDVDLQDGFLR